MVRAKKQIDIGGRNEQERRDRTDGECDETVLWFMLYCVFILRNLYRQILTHIVDLAPMLLVT